MKQYQFALAHLQSGLQIIQQLNRLEKSNLEWRRDLAITLTMLGNLHRQQDEFPIAANNLLAGLNIFKELVETGNQVGAKRDLLLSLLNLGELQGQQKNLNAARFNTQAAIELAEELVAKSSDKRQANIDLANCYIAMSALSIEADKRANYLLRAHSALQAFSKQLPANVKPIWDWLQAKMREMGR